MSSDGLTRAYKDLQRRYDDLLARNLAAIFRTTLDGGFLECNDAMAHMLGYENSAQLMARSAKDLYFTDEDRERFLSELREEGRLMNYIISLKHADGSRVEVMENVFLDVDPAKTTTIQGMAYDITPLRHAQREQQALLASYRALVEHIRDGIVLVQDGLIRFANPAAAKLLAKERPEGDALSSFFVDPDIETTIEDALNGADQERAGSHVLTTAGGLELVLFAERSTHVGRPAVQLTLQDRTGQRRVLKEQLRAQMAEEVNALLREEISEHKKTQAELKRSRRFSNILVDSSLDMIIASDPEGRITEFNPAAVLRFGWEREEVIGRDSRMLYAEPSGYDHVQSELSVHGAFAGELRNVDRDGQEFTTFLAASRLHGENGDLLGSMGVSRDITRMKQDQEALKASEERYRDLFENATDLIQSVDEQGRFQYVNSAWHRTLGYSEEEMKELTLWDIVHPDHKAECEQQFKNILVGTGATTIRTVFRDRDGKSVSVEGNSNVRRTKGKKVITRSILRDISKMVAAQQQVQEHEAKWRALFESSDHMFWTVDPEIKLTSFNKGYADMIMRLHGEAPELNNDKARPRKRFASPEYHDLWDDRYRHVFKGTPMRFETEITDRAGTRVTNEVFLSPVFDQSGRVKEVFGVGHEITDLKEAEEQVKERSARLKAIFDSSANMMIWTLDPDLRITSCNEHFLSSIEEEHGIRLKVGDQFADAMAQRIAGGAFKPVLAKYKAALAGQPQQFEVELMDRHGEPAWIENFLNPIEVDGKVQEVSCLAYGITGRKKDQIELERSLQEKEVLLQEVHHRVKNNLQIVSSIFNLQTAHVGDDERVLSMLRDSRDRIRSMSFIHESLYQHKDFSSIDLAGYIEGLSRNLMMSYSLNGKVELETELSPVTLVMDQAIPCGLILNELISNALKHAFPGGRSGKIRIELELEGRTVRIRVTDNGVGVPKGFDPRRDGNLGIELVETLTEQLDGTISFESRKGLSYLLTFERTK